MANLTPMAISIIQLRSTDMDANYVVTLLQWMLVPENVELEDVIHALFFAATTTKSQLRYLSSINMAGRLIVSI